MKQYDSSRRYLIKRALDLALGVMGFLLCAPLMFIIAAMIRSTSTGPVFFLAKTTWIAWKDLSHRKVPYDDESL